MPKYPIYIVSKGRWESRLTSKALEKMAMPYRIVVEPQEYEQYAEVIEPKKILILPFSKLGQGSIPARNWVWEHSITEGHKRHWILDDNIRAFKRWDGKFRRKQTDGGVFEDAERFADRYANLAIASMRYEFEISSASTPTHCGYQPICLNCRCYSCILIQNDIPFRWRGLYNEDTDLALRVLKAGWCTVQFYALLCGKAASMSMKGGNTDDLYLLKDGRDGRLEMAKSLVQQHPDVTKITRKWGRWQHQVDYRPFKSNKLKFADEYLAAHPELIENVTSDQIHT